MPVTVNDCVISDEMIESEAAFHSDAPAPLAAAACALAVRALLLDRARELGIAGADDPGNEPACEHAIETLLDQEAPVPEPTVDECRTVYDNRQDEFRSGDLVEASHILLAVTPNAPVEAIRRQAESVLKQALAAPESFGSLARQFSNCPSSAQDGNLGQLTRGETVPEFDRALFESESTGVLPRLVNTRYGFHIISVARRVPGRTMDFETAQPRIADGLRERVRAKAAEQYVRMLASRARIAGVDLGAADTPLMQ
jgi:peptidyl-prolyl cis-trans isomerase C